MNIDQKIERIVQLKQLIEKHCMCADFIEKGHTYTIIYPYGFEIEGITATKWVGKITALELLLERMEQDWQNSLWWKK